MSDMKSRMIEAVERGFTTEDNAYEYVRESMADAADQNREMRKQREAGEASNRPEEFYPEPVFMVGDRVVWNAGDEMGDLLGTVTRADFGLPYVMVKLDTGGTFDANRRELRRL